MTALAFAASCSGPELVDNAPPAEVAPPPPPAPAYVPPPPSGHIETTELLGGPSAPPPRQQQLPPQQGYAGGPPVIASRAVPNPGSTSVRQPGYAPQEYDDRGPNPDDLYVRPRVSTTTRAPRETYRETYRQPRHRDRVVTSRPVPNPPVAHAPGPVVSHSAPARPAPVRPAPVKPPVVAAKPAPITPAKPVVPVKPPVVAAKPPPVLAAKPVAKPVVPAPAKPKTKLEALGFAVAPDVTSGAKLTVPAELGAGKQAVVSLTLPASLADRVGVEAGKLGFARQARTVDARAVLSGEGYSIIPSASQSARLKAGEVTTFNWQVTPNAGPHGILKVDVSGDLKGGPKPQPFAIASLEGAPALPPAPAKKGFDFGGLFKPKPAAEPAEEAPQLKDGSVTFEDGAPATAASGGFIDKLSLPGMSNVDLPGLGAVKSGFVVLGALGFLALVLLMALTSRISSRRRAAERRRKFRTMSEFQAETPTYQEPEPVRHEPVYEHVEHHAPARETHHAAEHRKEDEHA